MALGRYTRIDTKRQSSSFCSTTMIVVFVALALVGVWMMTSPSVIPGQNVDVSVEGNKNEVKETVPQTQSNEGSTTQFEDSQGDLPEDATKGDTAQVNLEEKPDGKTEEETKSDDGSNTGTQSNTEGGDSKTSEGETDSEGGGVKSDDGQGDSGDNTTENKSDSNENENKTDSEGTDTKLEENSEETKDGETRNGQIEEKVDQSDNKESEKSSDGQANNQSSGEVFPSGAQAELLNETTAQTGSWKTQAAESKNENEAQSAKQPEYNWKLCDVTAGPDFIPCLDNLKAIKSLPSTKHYEHRERHCPEEQPTCLVPLPEGYKRPIEWPESREKVYCAELVKFAPSCFSCAVD